MPAGWYITPAIFTFLKRARTEWLRYLGFNNGELNRRHKMLWVVSEITINYVKPAKRTMRWK